VSAKLYLSLAFIDPFFSSGVHLALTGALSAAASIASSIRGEASEFEAAKYHSGKVGISYTRYVFDSFYAVI
jgi:flavin-dependent dehydrogenase